MALQVQQPKPRHRPQFPLLDTVQRKMAGAKPAEIVIRLGSQMRRDPLVPIRARSRIIESEIVRFVEWRDSRGGIESASLCG
jgi:hypothetical protein